MTYYVPESKQQISVTLILCFELIILKEKKIVFAHKYVWHVNVIIETFKYKSFYFTSLTYEQLCFRGCWALWFFALFPEVPTLLLILM